MLRGHERGKEYDTMSGLYGEYIETEVLPRVEKNCNVRLTKDTRWSRGDGQ
jgi:enterochelin esterase family protein